MTITGPPTHPYTRQPTGLAKHTYLRQLLRQFGCAYVHQYLVQELGFESTANVIQRMTEHPSKVNNARSKVPLHQGVSLQI